MSEDFEESQRRDQDENDFDFENKKDVGTNQQGDEAEKTQKIDNQHFDEAVELTDQEGSEIESHDEGGDQGQSQGEQKHKPQGKMAKLEQSHDFSEDGERANILSKNAYNPAEYDMLDVSEETKDLFKYIGRYKAVSVEIETKIKAFIPDYIPAVGEVDAFIKMPRPDDKEENMGLQILDEPTLNQSRKEKLDLIYNEFMKKKNKDKPQTIHKIENADKKPKEINSWINDVGEIHKKKQPPSVSYSKPMPDIDALMQVWPQEIEDALKTIKIPTEELDLSIADYSRFSCNLLDIPIHPNNKERNIIESLHVFFTLYSEFKSNQHFQQNRDENADVNTYQPNNSYV